MFEDVPEVILRTILESLRFSRNTLSYINEKSDKVNVCERFNNVEICIEEVIEELKRRDNLKELSNEGDY